MLLFQYNLSMKDENIWLLSAKYRFDIVKFFDGWFESFHNYIYKYIYIYIYIRVSVGLRNTKECSMSYRQSEM